MALHLLGSFSLCAFSRLPPRRFVAPTAAAGASAPIATTKLGHQAVVRRSANYKPCIWDHDYLQSLNRSVHMGEPYTGRADKLKDKVRMMLDRVLDPLDQLELIDNLQRLGLSYHFEDEIEAILNSIYTNRNSSDKGKEEDLYATALEFRLLRQHGFHVPQEAFNSFKDEEGNFKESLCKDTKGTLCLYEASYLSIEGENILDEARDFATKHLAESLEQNMAMDEYVAMQVSCALELPLHWRMPRLQTRWFIDIYERRKNMNPILLELAKLDFNMVQAVYQDDLKNTSEWWRHTGLGEKLSFARDRLVENFFWTVGKTMEPQYGYCRRMSTKVNVLITTIDDVYDVYGTLDELVVFTDTVDRWEINGVEHLPDYMKMCFLVLYNSINEIAYDALKEHGSYIFPYLKKAWADLCKAYLVEAKWYHSGYTPTLEEYLNNACISSSAIVILLHIYTSIEKPIIKEALECIDLDSSIIRWSSMILRLTDDLGTSSDEIARGDVPKSIQCYMHETGASEKDAREHIRKLIGETWKKMNKERFANSPFSQTFIGAAMNLARMGQCMYQNGDGHGNPDSEMKNRVMSLVIEPIPL